MRRSGIHNGGAQPRFCGWHTEPQWLRDSGTLFKVTEGRKTDGSLLHTKTCPPKLVTVFILIKHQVDPGASLLVGRYIMTCLHKGLLLSKEKEETINVHVNMTATQIHSVK